MAAPSPSTKLAKPVGKRDEKRLRSLLFDTETSLTFTPMQVMYFAVGFIFSVFCMHILVKLFPATSPIHIMVAVLVLAISISVSLYLHRK